MNKKAEIKCPGCGNGMYVNNGKTQSGSQKVKCLECGKTYTPNPKVKGYPQEKRDEAIKLHLSGSSGRQVGKVLGMSKANVYNWVKKNLDSVDK